MAAAVEVEDGGTDDSENSHGPRLDDPANRVTGPKRRSTVGGWTSELDKLLMEAYHKCQGKPWKKIAEMVPGKTDVQCLHRYQKVLHPSVHKGPWTLEEDNHLCELVAKLGDKKWSEIAKDLPGRIGKQCRERWNNHLKPSIDRSPWTKEEDSIIMRAHHDNGNRWAEIAKLLPGRTENSIKNRWNCSLKKKLLQWGYPQKLDEQLNFEGYPVMPLREYKRNGDAKSALSLSFGTPNERPMDLHATELLKNRNKSSSSDLIQQSKEEIRARFDNLRKDSHRCNANGLLQTCPSDYFRRSLMSESRPAGQEPKALDASLVSLPDRGFHCMRTNSADNCGSLVDMNSGDVHTTLKTPASPEASLASPAKEIQFSIACSGSPEAILRSRATTYKCMPSIIRKRRIEASPETTPCNKIRRMGESIEKLDYNQQFEYEDEPVSLELSLSLPSHSPKPEARTGRNRPVEKSLKREFDAVWDSSDKS